MPADEFILQVVNEWVQKAEADFTAAKHLLGAEPCPLEVVCFHAQQCAEKYLKAFLTLKSIDFPKTHSIEALIKLMPEQTAPNLFQHQQALLSSYATVTRYPGASNPVTAPESRHAVSLAKSVRQHVRRMLPQQAKKPLKKQCPG